MREGSGHFFRLSPLLQMGKWKLNEHRGVERGSVKRLKGDVWLTCCDYEFWKNERHPCWICGAMSEQRWRIKGSK
jgi:hypothetical protein